MLLTSLLLALFGCTGRLEAAPDCSVDLQPADIVFINDASGSVGAENFQKTLVFIENVVKGLVIGPYNAQIGSVTFESDVHLEFHLNRYTNQQDIVNRVRITNFESGGTATHLGLDYARLHSFTRANGMRTYAAQIAIVITDGESNDAEDTAAAAERLRDKGITVFSIGVGDGPDQAELRAIASDPDITHVFSVNNFNSLNQIKATLQKRACEAKPAYLCGGKADIIFLLESSDSVGPQNLGLASQFVRDVAKDFFLGADNVQIGLATFSSGFSQEFTLGQNNHRLSLEDALDHVTFTGGSDTNTGEAIKKMREQSFTTSAGHRVNVPKVAVLVTSGQSTDRESMFREAQKAKEAGISILALGVGPDIDDGEMSAFAIDGDQTVFKADAFEALKSSKGYVSSNICHRLKQEPSAATSSQQTCGTIADIVFLVDSSGRKENFRLLLSFVKSYIKNLDVGQDQIRVGVEKFSNRPYTEISLNRYNDSEELTKRINRIEPRRGGRDTAAAITYMESTMFKTANGDRPEVPNIAIILTDGKSNRPEETRLAAERARNHGIVIFTVGVGNETSRAELADMASDPDNRHVLTVTDFTKLNTVISALQGQTCLAIPATLPPYVAPVTTTPTPPPDTCKDQISNCRAYAKSMCTFNKAFAATNCAKSCGICSPSTPTVAPPCVDKIPDCPRYGVKICSGSSMQWARENCWRFCGYCSPGGQTVGVVNKCFYKGREYDQGDKWDDGCAYECECADAEKGQYVCYNKCPSFFNLPNKCKLEQKAGKCCLEPVCKFDGTYTLKEVDAMCVHNNKHYRQGQMWTVGCEFECICEDAATGFYACQSKCSKYDSLPSNCKLVRHQGECCERPDCEFQTQVGKFTGTGGSRKPTRVSAVNTTCVDKILDCDTYPADLCSSDTNRSFVLDNCRKFCNLCDPDSEPSTPGVCLYQGRSFRQGNTWHDGCEKTCVCDDAESGYVRCEDRCPDYLNLPHGCSLVTVPGQCCRSLSCDTPATFTGSQLQNDTVGALPARVQPARADEYPTLPPGETYAPGQNPALLVVPTSTQQPGVTAQRTSPSSPSLNDSVSGDDGRVMTSKITCDPAEEGHSTTLTCTARVESCPNLFKMKWYAGDREVVACTSSLCGSPYTSSNEFNTSISSANDNSSFIISSLTISNVSRISPFNMDTQWTCAVCGDWQVLECNKLQVYALPDTPECTVSEDTEYGDISSVTISCSTNSVYPRAKCSFYSISDDGLPVRVPERPDYIHTENDKTPVHYTSRCSVSVSVEELGEGTHRFRAYIYPDVSGGESLVDSITPNTTVNLTMPEAVHSCFPEAIDGGFPGNVTRCNCSLTSDGYPSGAAQWFRGDRKETNVSDGVLLVTKNDYLDQAYSCEAMSVLGRNLGSFLKVKFAVEEYHLPEQDAAPTAHAMQAESVNSGVVAAAVVATAVVGAAAAVATLLIKRHLSKAGGFGSLFSTAAEAPGAGKEDGLFPTESTPPNNDLEGPESGLNDYQTLDEATSTFKPDHGLAGYGEAQMMLNPLYEDGRST